MYTVRFNGNVGTRRRGQEVRITAAEYAQARRFVTVLEAPALVVVEENGLTVGTDSGVYEEETDDGVLHTESGEEFDSYEPDDAWGSDSDGGEED